MAHSPAPLIFAEWMIRLTRLLSRDELGPLLERVPGARPLFLERVFRNIQMSWTDQDKAGASAWMQLWHNARRWVG